MNYTDLHTGKSVSSSSQSASYITVSEDIILNWFYNFANYPNPMTYYIYFTTPEPGKSITLPDATRASVGTTSNFINKGNNDVVIKDFSGNNIITLESGSSITVSLGKNETSAGTWEIWITTSGISGITSLDATAPDKGISISGVPISAGSGTIEFELTDTLDSLENIGTGSSAGFVVKTDENTLALRELQSGNTNIEIENGNGESDNPIIKMNEDLTGLTSIEVGNLILEDNKITSDGSPLELYSNGNGIITDSQVAIKDNVTGNKIILSVSNGDTERDVNFQFITPPSDNFLKNILYIHTEEPGNPLEIRVSPYDYECVPGAMIMFDGTPILSPTILGKRNINSFTRLGTGSFEIIFDTPFLLSEDYNFNTIGFNGYSRSSSGSTQSTVGHYFTIVNSSTVRVVTYYSSSEKNFPYNCFIFYGILDPF